MNKLFRSVSQWYLNVSLHKNQVTFILFMTVLSVALTIIFMPLILWIDSFSPHQSLLAEFTIVEKFMLVLILAPLLETFIFQSIVISMTDKLKLARKLGIVISAFLFAASHLNSYSYAFANLLNGFTLAETYHISLRRGEPAIVNTCLVHAFHNLIFILPSIFP